MINKDALLPEVIGRWPATRRVFDAAGLKGCGGALGPRESVEFFARVHKVDLDQLLGDLETATSEAAPPGYTEDLGDILYRRFFRGALAILLFAGVALGVLAITAPVLGITLDLAGVVQAHGNAQLFGFIGLFVMGFACQGLPRFKYVQLWRPRLANAAFLLMIAGVALHLAIAIPGGRWIAVAGGALQAMAALLFLAVMIGTLRGTQRDAWDGYVAAGLVVFVVTAVLDPITMIRPMPWLPLRDLELLGFGVLVALGVSQRILPVAFGFRDVTNTAAPLALLLAGLALMPQGGILFAAGAVWLAWQFRALTAGDAGRSTKFIRAAYGWLIAGVALHAVEPWFATAAYHSAFRHAIGVGFLSLLIVGVSSKVVPILRGIDLAGLPSLWLPFVLLNTGNALRVGAEIAGVASLMALSGPLLAAGYFLWALHLWELLGRRVDDAAPPGDGIHAGMHPADVLARHPATMAVFEQFGFGMLRNPILRATLGRQITLRGACQLKSVKLDDFLSALNRAVHLPASFEV